MENKQIDNEEEMIQQAFQELLNDYLATKHRKRVEIITKAFNFANEAHKSRAWVSKFPSSKEGQTSLQERPNIPSRDSKTVLN